MAKPAAKVVWFFEDEPISAGSDLMIETTDIFTSLRIQAARRWHCGEFRVYAENEYGEDAASILVTVTCKESSYNTLQTLIYPILHVHIDNLRHNFNCT